MRAKFKRTRLWVDSPLQWRLMGRLTLYLVACSLVLFHVAFFYDILANLPEVLNRGVLEFYVDFFARQTPLYIALIVVLPIFLYDMIKFSNRFAGPLYRFRRTMEAMIAGKPVTPVKIRKRDLHRDWLPTFNALIGKWNGMRTARAAQVAEDVSADPAPEPSEPAVAASSGAAS
jgi:hypothetical protein